MIMYEKEKNHISIYDVESKDKKTIGKYIWNEFRCEAPHIYTLYNSNPEIIKKFLQSEIEINYKELEDKNAGKDDKPVIRIPYFDELDREVIDVLYREAQYSVAEDFSVGEYKRYEPIIVRDYQKYNSSNYKKDLYLIRPPYDLSDQILNKEILGIIELPNILYILHCLIQEKLKNITDWNLYKDWLEKVFDLYPIETLKNRVEYKELYEIGLLNTTIDEAIQNNDKGIQILKRTKKDN